MNSYKTKVPFWPNLRGYREIDLGLSRVYDLLSRLENPHLKMPPTIHIAGTNGKGSTLSFLKTIFEESGLKVHSYTSPHLVYFNERIKLAGIEISDQFLNEVLRECQQAAERKPQIDITFFEGITVAAFLAFSKVKADILLLETGMGGKLDATNVLDQVLCSIITPISFDHTDFLGDTLSKISSEKAGIIKNSCPTFIGKQKSLALKTIINKAKQQKSETFTFNQNWKIKKYKNHFLFDGFGKEYKLPLPSLAGDHQLENASLAIAVSLNQKKFKVSEDNIRSALIKTSWPARLQKIEKGKFHKILPSNCELYLDGSHNPQGSQTICKFLEKQKNKKIFVIFAMLQDKDCQKFLENIAPKIDHLFALEIANETKSRKAEEIYKIAKSCKIKSQISQNFDDSFEKISNMIKNNEKNLILVFGSLYLAGSFLEENYC